MVCNHVHLSSVYDKTPCCYLQDEMEEEQRLQRQEQLEADQRREQQEDEQALRELFGMYDSGDQLSSLSAPSSSFSQSSSAESHKSYGMNTSDLEMVSLPLQC